MVKKPASFNAIRLKALIEGSYPRFADFRRLYYTAPPTGLWNHFLTRIVSRGEVDEDLVLISTLMAPI